MTDTMTTPAAAYDRRLDDFSVRASHPLSELSGALNRCTNDVFQASNATQTSVRSRRAGSPPRMPYHGAFDRSTVDAAELLAVARGFASIAAMATRGLDSALEGLAVAGHGDEVGGHHETTVALIARLDALHGALSRGLSPASYPSRLGE